MIAELRAKSQITLPKSICKKYNLSVGSTFDVVDNDGVICFIPMTVHSESYVRSLEHELKFRDEETLATLQRAEKLRAQGVADLSIADFRDRMKGATAKDLPDAA